MSKMLPSYPESVSSKPPSATCIGALVIRRCLCRFDCTKVQECCMNVYVRPAASAAQEQGLSHHSPAEHMSISRTRFADERRGQRIARFHPLPVRLVFAPDASRDGSHR